MKNATVGLLTGPFLALVAAVGGGWALLLAVVLGAVGFLVGRWADGDLDLDLTPAAGRRDRG